MMWSSIGVSGAAALVFATVSAGVIAFQLALAAGAPWGAYAMGGAFPGRFPMALRIAAVVQTAFFALMAGVVVSRDGLGLVRWSSASRTFAWVVVAISAVSFVLNLITPSAGERAIWAPVAFLLLVSSAVVARGGGSDPERGLRGGSSRKS